MRENPKLTNALEAFKDSSSEESSESSDSSDSSSSEESNDEEDEEKTMRMKYTDFLKWKKYVKRKEVYSKPKKERHKPSGSRRYLLGNKWCFHCCNSSPFMSFDTKKTSDSPLSVTTVMQAIQNLGVELNVTNKKLEALAGKVAADDGRTL
ncbi:unnamed protein product [Cuscuta campestris]|uniref:Uncharacterized protein n=1 Tax=Cuscuta campestris TaxID=132261 RepID=A0A484KD13_9ASTE|nr:unnamed protein product [Cuscuta campestris]